MSGNFKTLRTAKLLKHCRQKQPFIVKEPIPSYTFR